MSSQSGKQRSFKQLKKGKTLDDAGSGLPQAGSWTTSAGAYTLMSNH